MRLSGNQTLDEAIETYRETGAATVVDVDGIPYQLLPVRTLRKLSSEDVQAIRDLADLGVSKSKLARDFNVSRPTIYAALKLTKEPEK